MELLNGIQRHLIVVLIHANDQTGLGFTYGHEAISQVIQSTFVPIIKEFQCYECPILMGKNARCLLGILVLEELLPAPLQQ